MAFSMNLGSLWIHLRADITNFSKAMYNVETTMNRVANRMIYIGKSLMLRVTLPLTAFGVASARAFGNFDDAMTQSLAIMGDMSDEMKIKMETVAKEISGRSITSTQQLAKSYYYLASAGYTAEQAIGALPVVERFAVAGMFDMSQATTLLADAQSALGLTSKEANQNMKNMTRVSDVLSKANALANAEVIQFSQALTNKAAAALKLLNKDIEEGVAVLAVFANQGVKGEEAGERLSIVLRDLQRASIKNVDVWKKMGLSIYDTHGKMLPLADIMGQLEKKFGTMSDRSKKAAAQMLGFQDRSFSSLQMLMGTSEQIREFEKALREAGGMTDEIANKQLKSFNSQMRILWNNVVLASIAVGDVLAPWISKLSIYVKKAIDWFRDLNEENKKWVVIAGIAVVSIGPLVLGLGYLLKTVYGVTRAFTVLGIAGTAWVAVAVLVAGAAWMVVDAFSNADLGILKFVNSLWVGGYEVKTWAQMFFTMVFEYWNKAATYLTYGLKLLQDMWKSTWSDLYYFTMQGAVLMAQFVVNKISWLVGQMIDIMDAGILLIQGGNTRGMLDMLFGEGTLKMVDKGSAVLRQSVLDVKSSLDEASKSLGGFAEGEAGKESLSKTLMNTVKDMEAEIAFIEKTSDLALAKLDLKDTLDTATGAGERNSLDKMKEGLENLKKGLTDLPSPANGAVDAVDDIATSLTDVQKAAVDATTAFGNAFEDLLLNTKDVGSIIKSMLDEIGRALVRNLVIGPMIKGLQGAMGIPALASANGNVFSSSAVVPFASGGVVTGPFLFGLSGRRLGLMGEKGTEAVMPLSRNDKGELGVKMAGGNRTSVVMNITTPNPDSFRRSASQIMRRVRSELGRA